MSLYDDLVSGKEKLSLIGLGYVGMPLAVAFAEHNVKVIGFDLKRKRSIYTNPASILRTKWAMK